MNERKDWAALLGRILLALTFVTSGFGKLMGFAGTAGTIAGKGVQLPEVAATLTILIELGGGLAMALVTLVTWWPTNAFMPFVIQHLVGPGSDSATVAGHRPRSPAAGDATDTRRTPRPHTHSGRRRVR